MADVQVSWRRDPGAVASYCVFFSLNGGPRLTLSVPRSDAGDADGYSARYSSLTPTPPALAHNDVVTTAGVQSVDAYGQCSPVVSCSPGSVALQIAPPPPAGPVAPASSQV